MLTTRSSCKEWSDIDDDGGDNIKWYNDSNNVNGVRVVVWRFLHCWLWYIWY